jgi:hypothetical protein
VPVEPEIQRIESVGGPSSPALDAWAAITSLNTPELPDVDAIKTQLDICEAIVAVEPYDAMWGVQRVSQMLRGYLSRGTQNIADGIVQDLPPLLNRLRNVTSEVANRTGAASFYIELSPLSISVGFNYNVGSADSDFIASLP